MYKQWNGLDSKIQFLADCSVIASRQSISAYILMTNTSSDIEFSVFKY
jgi:hypothetical protein